MSRKTSVTLADFIADIAHDAATRDKPAMQGQEQEFPWTYGVLNELIDSVARWLKEQGVKSGDPLLSYLPRNPQQLVMMLAIGRLGAVYIPQDPAANKNRVDSVLSQLQPKFLVTTNQERNHLTLERNEEDSESPSLIHLGVEPNGSISSSSDEKSVFSESTCQIILIDDQDGDSIDFSIESSVDSVQKASFPVVTKEEEAYRIYTSGSTGAPKSIPIRHAGMAYWMEVLRNKFNEYEDSLRPRNILENTSCAADPQIWNVLMAATFEACLHITDSATRTDNKALADYIIAREIDTALVVPTQLKKLIDELMQHPQKETLVLKVVFSTGEALTKDICERLFALGVEVIFNAYGPSQTTFGASILGITQEDLQKFDGNRAPIGLPSGDNVTFMIKQNESESELFDCRQLKAGESVTGELIIQSPYVTSDAASFYEDRSDRFAPGDKITVRRSGEGEILAYFEGRTGEFVKINGASYNLSGLANITLQQNSSGIQEAVFIYDSKRHILFAHVATSSDKTDIATITQLRSDIQAVLYNNGFSLPVYVIKYPESLPQQPAMGKVDKQALIANHRRYSFEMNLRTLSSRPVNLPIEDEIIDVILSSHVITTLLNEIDEKEVDLPLLHKLMGPDTSLGALGLVSIDLSGLVNELSNHFDIEIRLEDDISLLTVKELAEAIFIAKAKSQELIRFGLNEDDNVRDMASRDPVIFVFPDVTGLPPQPLIKALRENETLSGEGYHIVPLQARGIHRRADRTFVTTSLVKQAQDFLRVMFLVAPEATSWYLLGWSYGASIVAHTLAEYEKSMQKRPLTKGSLKLPPSPGKIVFVAYIDAMHPKCYQLMRATILFEKIVDMLKTAINARVDTLYSCQPSDENADHIEMINKMFNVLQEQYPGNEDMQRRLNVIKSNLLAIQSSDVSTLLTVSANLYRTVALIKQFGMDFASDTNLLSQKQTLGWSEENQELYLCRPYGEVDHFSILTNESFLQDLVKHITSTNSSRNSSGGLSENERILSELAQVQSQQAAQAEMLRLLWEERQQPSNQIPSSSSSSDSRASRAERFFRDPIQIQKVDSGGNRVSETALQHFPK